VNGTPVPPGFRSWFADPPAAAYLLPGEGAGLSDLIAWLLSERFRNEGKTAELLHWNVADIERESVEIAWRTPSFFFSHRIFRLPDQAELKKGARDAILAYLDRPEPSTVLVIPCTDRSATRAFAAVPSVRSAALREEQAVTALAWYAVNAAKRAGKNFPEEAAVFLVRWVGIDFSRVKSEMEKLFAFAGERDEIGREEIREVCIAKGSADPFALAEMLARGDRKGCLSLFRRFSRGAEASDYHALAGAIAWLVRKRLTEKNAPLSGRRGGEILSALSLIDRGLKGESGLSPEQVFEIHLLKLLL
jgi:DNA polymerase III delta subunit